MLRSIGKQSGEEETGGCGGKDLQKKEGFKLSLANERVMR